MDMDIRNGIMGTYDKAKNLRKEYEQLRNEAIYKTIENNLDRLISIEEFALLSGLSIQVIKIFFTGKNILYSLDVWETKNHKIDFWRSNNSDFRDFRNPIAIYSIRYDTLKKIETYALISADGKVDMNNTIKRTKKVIYMVFAKN